eukprot:3617171-Heterocapsa_arctica.AAC.1
MAKLKNESKARSSASRPPIPVPEGAPPGDFEDPWLCDPRNPMYIGLPGGPDVTIEQLRALRFSQADYDRLRGGPGSEHGFLWSDAIKLASRCPDFQDVFIIICRNYLEGSTYLTPELQARCRRRLDHE